MGTSKTADRALLERLQSQNDVSIGGEVYRCNPLELRIKYCGQGHGWKVLKKFERLEELATYWDQLVGPLGMKGSGQTKQVVVRECMEPTAVLPPEKAAANGASVVLKCDGACVHLDRNADTASVALVLNEGWRMAQGGLVAIMRFGATLLAVREWLDATVVSDREHGDDGRISGRHPGLKGWLADHCPDINYKTAYGYMCAAAGLRREAKLADDVPLLVMMGEDPVPEERAEKLRKRVQRILAESTLGLLREAASAPQEAVAKGGQRDGAGRQTKGQQAERDACAAWAVIGGKIDLATGWKFTRFLPAAIAREALSTVTTLQTALKARLGELGEE